ncbi:MAG: hypothetical protein LBH98_09855 [Chitinispirillales bacterium]|jgi:hypothetical protein|nr:hypothetical protein [Chitinispirillales bacterium]
MAKNRINVFFTLGLFGAVTLGFAKLEPLPEVVEARKAKINLIEAQTADTNKFIFFEENFVAGGYEYVYGGNTRVFIPEESGHDGDVAVCFELDPADYSGGAIVLYGTEYDLRDVFPTGALEFWVKGATGGEKGFIGLADNEMVDGVKTEILLDFDKYGGVKPYWTQMSIPLADFGRRGGYWDERLQTTIKSNFKWDCVKELLVVTDRGANKKFKIWLDNVYIVKNRYPEPKNLWEPYWDEVVETIEPAPVKPGADVKEITVIYEKDFKDPMKGEVYGGRTAFAQQNTTDPAGNPHVMAVYLDNADYSGVDFNWGKNTDMSLPRNNNGGIGFWAKSVPGVIQVFLGLTDNKGDGKNVGTSVLMNDFGKLDTNWNYFMIPLKEFSDDGEYWDENTNGTKHGIIDWSKIIGMSITTDKYVNRIAVEDPIKVFFSRIALIDKVPGYIDPDVYWDNFKSNAPDLIINDFENAVAEEWMAISGEESALEVKIVSQNDRELRDKYGRWHLFLDWSVNDWVMASYGLARRNLPKNVCDWSKHSAISFDAFSNRDVERLGLKITDEFKEEWTAMVTLKRGWNNVVVPFRKFKKSPYQSAADATVNGKLDLGNVQEFSFEPSEIGVSSKTLIDNLKLTQEPKSK